MNASVGKLSDGGSVCRSCFKEIRKLNPSINIKKYSLANIKDILQGKQIENPTIEQGEAPKMDSNLFFGLIKIVSALILIYLGIKYLFFT